MDLDCIRGAGDALRCNFVAVRYFPLRVTRARDFPIAEGCSIPGSNTHRT
jgi:hypothetical protein